MSASDPHPFDDALALQPAGEHRYHGRTSALFANMVGPYGGMTAAQLLQAVLQHPARLGEPVSLTVNFPAPVADGAFEVEARPLRTNRSTQHWLMLMTQDSEVVASATALLALRRPTWSAPEAQPPAGHPAFERLPRRSTQGYPAWISRYDMRFVSGGMAHDFDGVEQPDSLTQLWVRDEPPRPLDFVSLAAMCDCFAPRTWVRRHQRGPAGTVTMTVNFHADAALLAAQGDRPLLAQARAQVFRDGYCDQLGELWSADGQLLAGTQQIQYYKT
jgi:acyl-CoA thioesterase